MAKKQIPILPIPIDKEKLMRFGPFIALGLVVFIFLLFIFLPQRQKLSTLSAELRDRRQLLLTIDSTAENIDKFKQELKTLKEKVSDYEQRLPQYIEARLVLDTLKAITEESKLKFISIQPQDMKRIKTPQQAQLYVELPVRIKLKCSYDEILDFITKIENSKRLMKVTSLKIRNNPTDVWEHDIDLTISSFARSEEQ